MPRERRNRALPSPSRLTLVVVIVNLATCHLPGSATCPGQSLPPSQSLTVALDVDGLRFTGTPLYWNQRQIHLLGHDGALFEIDPARISDYRVLAETFTPSSQSELRRQLLREFGPRFDVSGTGHFLVVHPAGQRDRWSSRFEDLYRSFLRFATVRGFQPKPLAFPLIAVVFPRREEFVAFARQDAPAISDSLLGYYSPTTNRIIMYDLTGGDQDDPNWQVNAATIIHEAAHQVAFNLGLHNRFAPPPRWVVEGLGTMFEAQGYWDARFTQRAHRINRRQLDSFRTYEANRRRSGAILDLVGSNRSFEASPEDAYAEAWALSFYLSEVEPRKYMEYLTRVAARPSFAVIRSPEALEEFRAVFGDRWDMLEARFLRFIKELK